MKNSEKFVSGDEAGEIIKDLGPEFTIVKNPDYIHPAFEVYPLAPKITQPVDNLVAAVMDMDGTTTTTEALCIHSLEFMVRKISGKISRDDWQGLDSVTDYPHIIGNSTTKHVEYLIQTYAEMIQPEFLKRAYFSAVLWFLIHGKDQRRISEVKNNLSNLGCQDVLKDEKLNKAIDSNKIKDRELQQLTEYLLVNYGGIFQAENFSTRVRAAIDIYYQRYHEILNLIQAEKGASISEELLGKPNVRLIEPMPGVAEFLALVKGWLVEDIWKFIPLIINLYQENCPDQIHKIDIKSIENKLHKLVLHFQKFPLKVAVVTSSIFYEAQIVMTEVFRVLHQQVANWDVSQQTRELILNRFLDYQNVYDGFVTASDSSEIRLKPHHDLYSIALHQLGIPKEKFKQVVGFEDSESGTIAIRAAGIGLCVAVPFSDTQHHDLRAAAYVLNGGLPEAMVKYGLFLY